jgi:hypothetical protein
MTLGNRVRLRASLTEMLNSCETGEPYCLASAASLAV